MNVSRNAPCPCGSGRKFKRCCLDRDNAQDALFGSQSGESDMAPDEDDFGGLAETITIMVHNDGPGALPRWLHDYLTTNFDCLPYFVDGFLDVWSEIDESDDSSDDLAETYAYLLQVQLSSLGIGVENKYTAAAEALAQFEQRLIDAIECGEASGSAIMAVSKIMFQARLPVSPRLARASESVLMQNVAEQVSQADPAAICAEIAEQCGGDPFLINEAMLSGSHISPGGLRATITLALLTAPEAAVRDAAALGVLDSDPESRHATAAALVRECLGITPATLRRLITIRRWLPEAERPPIDQAVTNARLRGIESAPWQAGEKIVEIRGSQPDGAGAQMAMVVSKAASGYRLSGLLFKQGKGVVEAWTNDPEPRRDVNRMLKQTPVGVPLLQVSAAFLDRLVAHYLHEGPAANQVAPVEFLEVAELLHTPQWQPALGGWQEMLDDLIAQVPENLRAPASVRTIIASSAAWATRGAWAASWLEDQLSVAEVIDHAGRRGAKAVRAAILGGVTEKRRAIWAERFTLTALWMQQAQPSARMPWRNLTIVARALVDGVPLREIALMNWIARESANCMNEEYADA